uniref:Uncharacterized protein n=1 Tax=Hippocampus comes TaxID=109280 RepID=A0A3Q2XNB8_HIPCM
MKLVVVLTFSSMAVMAVMILQTVRQELQLRHLRTRTVEHLADSKRGERVITLIKSQIKELETNLASVMGRVDELKKRKAAAEKAEQEHQKRLQASHYFLLRKAEEEMQNVKQHILDRDKAVCIFADPSFAEVR